MRSATTRDGLQLFQRTQDEPRIGGRWTAVAVKRTAVVLEEPLTSSVPSFASLLQDIMDRQRSRTPPALPHTASAPSRRQFTPWNGVQVDTNGGVWILEDIWLMPATSIHWTFGPWALYRVVEVWVLAVEPPPAPTTEWRDESR